MPGAASADTGSNELTLTASFQLSASVQAGCVLGGGSTDATSFGSIDFGQLASLSADVKVASTVSGGSIQLQCTPGTALTISLNSGANAARVRATWLKAVSDYAISYIRTPRTPRCGATRTAGRR